MPVYIVSAMKPAGFYYTDRINLATADQQGLFSSPDRILLPMVGLGRK